MSQTVNSGPREGAEEWISVSRAARILDAHPEAIRGLIRRGELKAFCRPASGRSPEKLLLRRAEVEQLASEEAWQRRWSKCVKRGGD